VKVSNSKGIANHIGPESCVDGSNSIGEALTGEQAGWVLSHEKDNKLPCADHFRSWVGKITSAITQAKGGHGEVGDPKQAWKHFERESGEPWYASCEDGTAGRIRKSKDRS
jgi:hypothetical protein